MIQKFVYKRATMEDIDELVRTRIIVLRAANKLPDDEDMSVVEKIAADKLNVKVAHIQNSFTSFADCCKSFG